MPKAKLREFAVGSEKGKPEHVSSYAARLKAKRG
jgi:hypothetical protein